MDLMFTFIRILTNPALLLWFLVVPKCNVTIIWSERDNLRAHYNRVPAMSNCLELNWIRDNGTERDTEAVMYFDTCLLLRLIGHQCRDPGNMRAMASDENTLNTINIGCCWPLVVISTLIVPQRNWWHRVTSHTDNIRGLARRQWAPDHLLRLWDTIQIPKFIEIS